MHKDPISWIQETVIPLSVEEVSLSDTEVSDEILLSTIGQGAIEAMEMLYARYHRLLSAFAYHIVGDYQVAEDLVQDTFLAVWRKSTTYTPQRGTVRRWLYSITYHCTINYLRSKRRHTSSTEAARKEAEERERSAHPDVWEEVWQSIQQKQLHASLKNLSAQHRLVIELAYFHGLTHAEISAQYHIALGTVKSRIREGLKRLKVALE